MRTTLLVCLIAISPALSQEPASALAGTWEGNLHGQKAVTLTIQPAAGQPQGEIVFYILKDEGSGFHAGAPSAPIPLRDLQRDGSVLRFSIPHGARPPLVFQMRLTGSGAAVLSRLKSGDEPEITVALRRLRGV